ncbi:MAG TPA: endoglucanase [Actinocatenispora sp.]
MRRVRARNVLALTAVGGALALGVTMTSAPPVPARAGASLAPEPSGSGPPSSPPATRCGVDDKLVPSCGVLWGAATGGHTSAPTTRSLRAFEQLTGRTQTIFHTYHRGTGALFPTADEIALASDKDNPRILFTNWKPAVASWAAIARGDSKVDGYLDRVAANIKQRFPDRFFLTIHHEPENDVVERPGSGYTAANYAAMYRHVVQRLRADGVTNAVFVMDYMAYPKWAMAPWHDDLYPGDDVVDWIAWDTYAYSSPGYGYGDFGEMVNRGGTPEDLVLSGMYPLSTWPGFYTWASKTFPDKPLMLGEWGVWAGSDRGHKSWFFDDVGTSIGDFPRLKALVYFDTPGERDSRVNSPKQALGSYQDLGKLPVFQVGVDNPPTSPSPSPTGSPSPSPSPSPSDSASPSPSTSPSPSGSPASSPTPTPTFPRIP